MLCGAEGWQEMEEYGKSKLAWLKTFLELPHGIPSDDTFRRVFSRLDPEAFERFFSGWIENLVDSCSGEVIPIDGKTLRHSFDSASAKSAIHMVSAWSSSHRIVLGQVRWRINPMRLPRFLNYLKCSTSPVML